VEGIAADPTINLDVSVPPRLRRTLPVEDHAPRLRVRFSFGDGKFCNASGPLAVPTEAVGWADTKPPTEADNRSLVLFEPWRRDRDTGREDGVRFLAGLGEAAGGAVAWYGPIVMNTQRSCGRRSRSWSGDVSEYHRFGITVNAF